MKNMAIKRCVVSRWSCGHRMHSYHLRCSLHNQNQVVPLRSYLYHINTDINLQLTSYLASLPGLLHLQFLIACSMTAYYKRSKTGSVEGPGMRLRTIHHCGLITHSATCTVLFARLHRLHYVKL